MSTEVNVNDLTKQLLFSTVQIETVYPNGARGSGTGFYVRVTDRRGHSFPYVITNRHVVEGTTDGYLNLFRQEEGQPKAATILRHKVVGWDQLWFFHSEADVDLAALPFAGIHNDQHNIGQPIYYNHLTPEFFASQSDIDGMAGIEDVIFIGYPNGIWDRLHGFPVVRKGISATPIEHDFEGRAEFLIDASVFPGSSGSPVFTYNGGVFHRDGMLMTGPSVRFVGVVKAVYFKTSENEIIQRPAPTAIATFALDREALDLGVVVKARKVFEFIQHIEAIYEPIRDSMQQAATPPPPVA